MLCTWAAEVMGIPVAQNAYLFAFSIHFCPSFNQLSHIFSDLCLLYSWSSIIYRCALVEGWRERRTQYTSCKGITFSFVHDNHISLLQGVRGQFVFEVEYFIFRIVFQAEGRLHYKPWCIGRRMIMQIIVTVLSSSQNLLADMMLEAAAAASRSENTPLAIVWWIHLLLSNHRPLGSDY